MPPTLCTYLQSRFCISASLWESLSPSRTPSDLGFGLFFCTLCVNRLTLLSLDWYAALEKVDFHSCMHGGRRAKKTRLLASPGLYTSLAQECDRAHDHLPWGVQQQGDSLFFSTAEEAEYPHLLCKRMAQCLVDYSALQSIPLSSPQSSAQRARNAWGSQTSNSRPLIAEFRDFVYPTDALDTPGYRLLASPSTGATNTEMQVEHSGEEDPTDLQETDEAEPANKRRRQTYKYGIQWHPEEFSEAAPFCCVVVLVWFIETSAGIVLSFVSPFHLHNGLRPN